MSPPKLTSKYKAIAAMGTPSKHGASKAANSPMTSTDWRRRSSETLAKSPLSSPVLNADGDDSDEDAVVLNMKGLGIHDEDGVDIKTSMDRYKMNKNAKGKTFKAFSSGLGHGSFVQHGAESRAYDPFGSASYQMSPPPAPKRISSRISGNWRSGSSGNGSGHSNSPACGGQNTSAIKFDDDEQPPPFGSIAVSGQNAQQFYPPSACVFVANLSQAEDEQQLEFEVTKVFRKFGVVFVKIRRDNKNMPFAFCQYTDDNEAIRAIIEGKGREICGRPCRTEPARANRTFYMCRKVGNGLTLEEGCAVLEQYGAIDSTWLATDEQKKLWALREGFFVQFVLYGTGLKAQRGIREEGNYQLESTSNQLASPLRPTSRYRSYADRQMTQNYLNEYQRDRNSVYVGNLPDYFTEADLRALFAHYGEIVNAELIQRPSTQKDNQLFVFGFVEYKHTMAAKRAIDAKNGFPINGCVIKVCQKDSERSGQQKKNDRPFRAIAGSAQVLRREPDEAVGHPAHHTPHPIPGFDASHHMYASPYGYGYPHTPYYSGYAGYAMPQYPSQYGYTPPSWMGAPQYPGFGYPGAPNVGGSPLPPHYPYGSPYLAEFCGNYYQTMPNYQQYASPDPTMQRAQEDRSQSPTPAAHSKVSAEEQEADAQ